VHTQAPPARWLLTAAAAVLLVAGVAWARVGLSLLPAALWGQSHGLAVAGGLSGGAAFPPGSDDSRTQSYALAAVGRQYVHPSLAQSLAGAFAEERSALARRRGMSMTRWRVAETGWRTGGWFPPHLTHQSGLSVDIVTPLTTSRLPSSPASQLGYGVQLDPAGIYEGRSVDFERLAKLFDALCTQAPKHGLVARRFVVWEPWQGRIRGRMRSGCRTRLADASLPHDDHVHVTFTASQP